MLIVVHNSVRIMHLSRITVYVHKMYLENTLQVASLEQDLQIAGYSYMHVSLTFPSLLEDYLLVNQLRCRLTVLDASCRHVI